MYVEYGFLYLILTRPKLTLWQAASVLITNIFDHMQTLQITFMQAYNHLDKVAPLDSI
jgi:hypothetical protein